MKYATDSKYSVRLLYYINTYGLKKYDEVDYVISKNDAEQIISIISDYWHRMHGNKDVQDFAHYLANKVRKAAGIEIE